jgi:hypothetical protein
MAEKNLYAGMDLRENKIQLCAYPPGRNEIITLLEDFPLALAIEKEKKEWLFGEEALAPAEGTQKVLITDFLELLETKSEIKIFSVSFSVEELLAKVIKKALFSLKRVFPNDFIKRLVVSVERPSARVKEGLLETFLKLGLDKDRLRLESHEESFLCYAISRPNEPLIGEAGLFDGDGGRLIFHRLALDRSKFPMLAGVTRTVLDVEKPDETLLLSTMGANIGTLYLTGSAFAGEDKLPMLQSLCEGRRVFLGENLYCEGACISARREDEPEITESFFFLNAESIGCDISIPISHASSACYAFLAKAAEIWYEAGKSACLILDGETEIPIRVYSPLDGKENIYIIALEGLWNRPERMTKVLLKTEFADQNTCIVTVKDLGFGEFCPSSRRIWEKIITI